MDPVLHYLSFFFLLSGGVIALFICLDIFRHRRQRMRIMEIVWPLTGLWANWLGLWAYLTLGRAEKNSSAKMPAMKGAMSMDKPIGPQWRGIVLSTLHCGAGCTIADILGETFTAYIPVAVGGSLLAGQWILDYILALGFGVFFQYAAIRPMERISRIQVVIKAFKIDFFSLTAWQLGMYGWMAISMFLIFRSARLPHSSWEFWFMMQIAMFFGFLTSYPANWLLIRLGIKRGM